MQLLLLRHAAVVFAITHDTLTDNSMSSGRNLIKMLIVRVQEVWHVNRHAMDFHWTYVGPKGTGEGSSILP